MQSKSKKNGPVTTKRAMTRMGKPWPPPKLVDGWSVGLVRGGIELVLEDTVDDPAVCARLRTILGKAEALRVASFLLSFVEQKLFDEVAPPRMIRVSRPRRKKSA